MKELLIIQSEPFIIPERLIDKIKDIVEIYKVSVIKYEDVKDKDIANVDIIYGYLPPKRLKKAKKLKWIHLPMAGVESFVDRSLYSNDDIIVTNSSGVFGKPIAEHAISLVLAFNRNIHKYINDMQKAKWQRYEVKKDFFNSTVAILGLGDIGSEVAKRSKALGANVIAIKKNANEEYDYIDKLYTIEELNMVLSISDVVVLALPETDETIGLISKKQLEIMKNDAFIVNVGRGSAIDTKALEEALMGNQIAGVGLDVTDPEPLDSSSPLWNMENVIITAHTSGLSPSGIDRNAQIFIDNYLNYVNNLEMKTKVDFDKGY